MPMIDDLPDRMGRRLARPLPGEGAQSRFEPELSFGRHRGPAPATARRAAVMVLLYPHQGAWWLPLTLRPAHMAEHAGQVSLPGGLIEPGEESPCAAQRELEEELGVPAAEVRLLGRLTELYIFGTDYQVTPWVGWINEPPTWSPSAAEVAEVLEVPLAHFSDPANQQSRLHRRGRLEFMAPHYPLKKHQIWGATSMILSELAAVVEST